MNRRLSILFALTSILLVAVLVSACKPETRSSPAQQASTATAQPAPTATAGTTASTSVVTSTLNKPPACRFNSTAPITALQTIESYTFSEPRVVYTRTKPTGLFIYGWSPNSKQLLIDGYNYDSHRHTLEVLDIQSGIVSVYAERKAGGWAAWLPQQQAVAYADFEYLDQSQGTYRDDLWVSWGSPQQAKRIAIGADAESLGIDPAGRLTFFSRERSGQPLGSKLQQIDAKTQVKQVSSLDLADWDFSNNLRAKQDFKLEDLRLRSNWRPSNASQVILNMADSGLLLADAQTGQICEIDIRQQNKPLVGSHITWSPDGRYLAMSTELATSEGQPGHLAVIDMNTGQQFSPDLGPGNLVDLKWGGSSQQIAALMQVVANGSRDSYRLYMVDVRLQTVQRVLPEAALGGAGSGSGEMSWSPDGTLLAINCPDWQNDKVIVAARVCLLSANKAP
jgi:hypothetical protein